MTVRGTAQSSRWGVALRLARRDFSWRFKGLRLLIVCLFLGAGALAAIGTLEGAIRAELSDRGQEILGGDVEFAVYAREASAEELTAMRAMGAVSGGRRVQAMAAAGTRTVPIQLKSVDASWPLYGTLTLADGRTARAPPDGSAWAGQGALDRLGIGVGDTIRLGERDVRVGGVIANEPDRLSEGFALGPAVLISDQTLSRTGLAAYGSAVRSKYRVALPADVDPADAVEAFETRFPEAGWSTRTRERASPGADRLLANMGQFLSLVGLAALVIAGIGIAGAVSSWLESRRGTIATMKVLGADSSDVLRIHVLQVMAAALAGISAGLLVGVSIVPALASLLRDLLPVSSGYVFDGAALARAAAFALLVALVFSAPPLIAARRVTAMALLRARVAPPAHMWRDAALPVGLGLVAIAALALWTSYEPWLTAGFLGAAAAVLGLLALIGIGVRRIAGRIAGGTGRRGAALSLRLGIGALDRPGSPTVALVTALGFGLSAFAAIAFIQTALDRYIAGTVPDRAPDYFVLDVPQDDVAGFTRLVTRHVPGAEVRTVPALRGAILAYGPAGAMTRVADMENIPEGAWALRGERGLTYSARLPVGNRVTAGEWWPASYDGPALVSVDEELARALDLSIGDRLAIGLLGIEREATIASFRAIEWDDFGFNHALVFSPGAIDDAPHNYAASIILPPGADSGRRGDLLGAMVAAYPSSSAIELGRVLAQARDLLRSVAAAVLGAAAVAVLAGMAVLLGAIAAARARETYDTIVLRVLGASRRQLLGALILRYAVLAALLSVVALALGLGAGWYVMVEMFEFTFDPDWAVVAAVLLGGAAVVVITATLASLPVLRARPARALRSL
ncbi:ABC transporter permease [Croceicoccus hydrothermalis]|uniref:ABC transporter permease n=1 Tax=Croceicoccus hydrothermalis TaxID=2867964 RepID=UPI001EFA3A0C|nr:FtsX-like permease family protein [Croceicoccus hydrothermalis]